MTGVSCYIWSLDMMYFTTCPWQNGGWPNLYPVITVMLSFIVVNPPKLGNDPWIPPAFLADHVSIFNETSGGSWPPVEENLSSRPGVPSARSGDEWNSSVFCGSGRVNPWNLQKWNYGQRKFHLPTINFQGICCLYGVVSSLAFCFPRQLGIPVSWSETSSLGTNQHDWKLESKKNKSNG